ncbi:MAG: LysR substrate-binding domain-containing protein [Bradyrhizobium sp.]
MPRPSRAASGFGESPLVWVTSRRDFWSDERPLPLVVSPKPCLYRKPATEELDRAHCSWRIAYTCGSLAESIAAVKAGRGIRYCPSIWCLRSSASLDGACDQIRRIAGLPNGIQPACEPSKPALRAVMSRSHPCSAAPMMDSHVRDRSL